MKYVLLTRLKIVENIFFGFFFLNQIHTAFDNIGVLLFDILDSWDTAILDNHASRESVYSNLE